MQHQVGRGHAFAQTAGHMHSDHIGRQEVNWLAEHSRFGLDPADAPPDHAEAVDHSRVRIGSDQSVRVIDAVFLKRAFRQVFQVDLMHDADAGRDDFECVEGLHPPFQKLIARAVALEFYLHVFPQRVGRAGDVDLHRVVDDQVYGNQRLDDLRVLAEARHGRTHRGQVYEQRHAGEILQDYAGHDERDFGHEGGRRPPIGQGAYVGFLGLLAVAVAQHRFEHDANADGQLRDRAYALLFQFGQRIEPALLSVSEIEFLKCVEEVVWHTEFPDFEELVTTGMSPNAGIVAVCAHLRLRPEFKFRDRRRQSPNNPQTLEFDSRQLNEQGPLFRVEPAQQAFY